jgi:hypothetical protein
MTLRSARAVLCLAFLAVPAGCGTAAPPPAAAASPAPTTASPAPPPSPSPSPAPPSVTVPAGVLAGIAVYDRQAGTFLLQRNATTRFRSASLVKLLIALDYLWTKAPAYAIPAGDRARFDVMLRSSDDNAASWFWGADGRDAIVTRMVARLGLQNTAPPSAVGRTGWGSTTLSAADLVRVYRYLLESAPAPVRAAIVGDLEQSTKCGTDHYDQSFGIPSAFARPWAVKQGWYGFGEIPEHPCAAPASTLVPTSLLSGAVLHTTGTVGPDHRVIVVVLTQHPDGTPFASAAALLTRLTRALPVPGGLTAGG